MDSRRLLRALLLLAALFAGGAMAAARVETGDRVSERGVLEDPAGQWTVEDVQSRAFKPYTTPFSHGNARTPVWFRLVVPAQPAGQPLVLVIQPAIIREILAYTQDEQGAWQRHELGNRYAFRDRERSDLNFSLDVKASTDHPTVIYLRMLSHTATMHAEVLDAETARDLDTRLHVVLGIYLGLSLVFSTLSALLWWGTRDRLWGAAALFDLTTLIHSSLALGFFQKYVAPGAVDFIPGLFTITASTNTVVGCMVFALMIRMLGAPRWAMLGYLVSLLLYPLWLAMVAQGKLGATLVQVNLVVLATSLWGIPAMLAIRARDPLLAWLYRIFAGVLSGYMIMWIAPTLHPGGAGLFSLYPAVPSNLFTMVMMALIMARRTLLAMRERQRLERDAREAEQRLRLEQAHLAETEGMLGMIMHEMKNPLTSIRLASELLASGRVHDTAEQEKRFRNIQEAVDGIDTVLNRCLDVDRLEQGALIETRLPEDVATLLRQWLANHRQRARIQASLPEAMNAQVDARLMLLMLGNLVDNALKYSPPQSPVALALRSAAGSLELEVRNTPGRAGWPDPERLFQKYYRSSAAQHDGGTGLGLYWVQRVSQQVGGGIDYRRDGDDVVFTLRMPA